MIYSEQEVAFPSQRYEFLRLGGGGRKRFFNDNWKQLARVLSLWETLWVKLTVFIGVERKTSQFKVRFGRRGNDDELNLIILDHIIERHINSYIGKTITGIYGAGGSLALHH